MNMILSPNQERIERFSGAPHQFLSCNQCSGAKTFEKSKQVLGCLLVRTDCSPWFWAHYYSEFEFGPLLNPSGQATTVARCLIDKPLNAMEMVGPAGLELTVRMFSFQSSSSADHASRELARILFPKNE